MSLWLNAWVAALALLAIAVVGSCAVEESPAGPPRCEPSVELEVERGLKQGYKALVARDPRTARKAFAAVVKRARHHPEAQSGLRQAERLERAVGQLNTRMAVMLAGHPVAVAASVNSERMRYEEEMARRALRGRVDGGRPDTRPVPFQTRKKGSGDVVGALDAPSARHAIELIVLHDTFTSDARMFFVESSEEGKSTHFLIDYDGTIYQTLDLGYAAQHTGIADVDRRSVDISIVNPVDEDRPALPSGVTAFARHLSPKTMRHGRELRQWGYTKTQMRSLRQLVNGLIRVLPQVPSRLARGPEGAVRRRLLPDHGKGFRGVVGHAQLSDKANDPSVALDWDTLQIP